MTVVLAKRFGDQIEIVADTAISDRDLGRENAFPGRLKIIPLSRDLTVAYAGHSDPALHAIRQLHGKALRRVDEVLDELREFTASSAHDVEFLVVAHQGVAELRKVWRGLASDNLDDAALGETRIRGPIYERLDHPGQNDPSAFYTTFLGVFTSDYVDRGPGVGGFPTGLKASAEGHFYRGHSYHGDRKEIRFLPGVEQHQDPADMQTGDWTFHHSIFRPQAPGVPVLGAQIQQARRAYIYSPLFEDDPVPVFLLERDVDWTEHQEEMNERTAAALEQAVSDALARMA